MYCHYFTRLKAREINRQNVRNSENIGHVIRGVRRAMTYVYVKTQSISSLIG